MTSPYKINIFYFYLILASTICLNWECNLVNDEDKTDGQSDVIKVKLNNVFYTLTGVGASTYMDEKWYSGKILGKTLYISTYYKDWKNDTCQIKYYDSLWLQHYQLSYVRYDTLYNVPNYGLLIVNKRIGNREEGTMFFDILSGNDTLHFTEGSFDVYVKQLE